MVEELHQTYDISSYAASNSYDKQMRTLRTVHSFEEQTTHTNGSFTLAIEGLALLCDP
jgi:hypothetical protein